MRNLGLLYCILAGLLLHSLITAAAAHGPWDSFRNLTGCHRGESRPGLTALKRYLHHFGYLPSSTNFSDEFDDTFQSALRRYQRNFHLNATGALDNSTVDVLSQPRCGVPDVVNATSGSAVARGRNLYTYFPGVPKWPEDRRELTYAFSATGEVAIDRAVLRAVFSRAFARWAAVTTITFSEVESPNGADIRIGFFRGDHGDGEPFDGELGTLAHAFSPTNGRLHMDADERWVAALEVGGGGEELLQSPAAIDLESVAVHEIGHLLGLGHSSVEGAVMYPSLRSGVRKVELAADDIDGVRSLYGAGDGASAGTTPTTMTEREVDVSGAGKPTWGGRGSVVGRIVAAAGAAALLVL